MRVLSSNPDTLGDLVLRQPMYRALAEAGHELALIVRRSVVPLVRYVAPGARVLELPYEAYAGDLEQQWGRFTDLFAHARDFNPDLLLVAPYRWTLFEEKLAQELTGVRTAGMSGHLYAGDPYQGLAPASKLRFDVRADGDEDAPEFEKNAALASAVLGASSDGSQTQGSLPPPRLEVDDAGRRRAGEILDQLGLEPGGYWVACVTGTAHVSLKAWPAEHWARVLTRWAHGRGRRFLFVGLPDEEPVVRAVREQMGAAAEHTSVWMPPGGTIDELLGLTALSAGYVGHDTGPMHVAAAMGKPVLAVFGGGHRLRFQPAVEPSVTLTVGVSCAGCEWSCSFATSHCVKAVPVDDVWAAALDLEDGRVTGREARVIEPSRALQRRMVREAAGFAQSQLRERSELGRKLAGAYADWERDVGNLRQQIEARSREAGELTTRLAARAAEVEQAHAATGAMAREVEAVRVRLVEQDAQLREKEVKIAEQHALLQEKEAALLERAEESSRLAGELDELRAELDSRVGELTQVRAELQLKAQAAGALSARLALQSGEIERVRTEINGMIEQVNQVATAGNNGDPGTAHVSGPAVPAAGEVLALSRELLTRQDKELADLREQVKQLEDRLRALEPHVRRRGRTLREIATDLVVGKRHYVPHPPPTLPSVTIVTPVLNAAPTIRETIESVVSQNYTDLEYIVVDGGSTDGTLDILEEYKDRIDRVITGPDAGPFDALAKGFAAAEGQVLGYLFAGDVMEPGGVLRVAELFSRRQRRWRRVRAVYFEDALLEPGGWRFPPPPQPTLDVRRLLKLQDRFPNAVFFTANAYRALGGFDASLKHAGDWDWLVRLVRRYGIIRGEGQVRATRRRTADPEKQKARREELARARANFLRNFGIPGRLRTRALQVKHKFRDARRPKHPRTNGKRLSFPLDPARSGGGRPLPPAEPPALAPGQPVSPLSDRMPDRLLFSSRDVSTGDPSVHYVYYDPAGDAALAYPPMGPERLNQLYAARAGGAGHKEIVPPDPAHQSPYIGYTGSRWGKLLARLPSPYWWLNRPDYGDTTVDELFDLLVGRLPLKGPLAKKLRLLNVACFRGEMLDALTQRTDWQLFGAETNASAVLAARLKGHKVWEASAQDAAQLIPVGEQFDVILLGHTVEHLQNPAMVLRRLRQLLTPGGLIAFNAPNLDSKHAEIYGPTWAGWQLPYHRTIMGRKGVERLAMLTDMELVGFKTKTHPYPATVSAQLNRLGLGAVVPEGAKFPNAVSSRGVRLTGWSRMLWDWRGKGDYLYALLKYV